ncbi:myelin expression factor 2 [Plakobranchus ocellatus]|uniref:Myelin expression factor 2 n=1 Tax=Plakobranchus ocellatus TaxID=259542 RepID=A0AAV3YP47_9GAST|nr:myelin expression factor 2 [Plakobranchus ocellatus]
MAEAKQERVRSRSRSPVRRSRSRSPRRNRNDRPRNYMCGRRVVVRNIPYEVRWQELKDMFRKDIGDVTYVEMLETPDGKSKGVAVVEFRDPEHAKKAMEEYHQKKIHDRAIIVREEREKDRQEFMQHNNMRDQNNMGPSMGPGPGMGVPPGVNPQVLQNLGIEPPITNTVFVANLEYKVTWWKLKDVFKLAGNVIKAEIKEDKNGKSRGMGVVVFEHPMEAVQAVSMFNGQVLYERNMIVRIDKGPEPDKPKLPSGLKSIGMGLGSGGSVLTNFAQMGPGNYGLPESLLKPDLGLGGSGLMGINNLGGSGIGGSGLGLLGSGLGGGSDVGISGLGGMGGGLNNMGLGIGGSNSLNMGSGAAGMNSMPDLGMAGSKMGVMSDNYMGMGGTGSNFNGNSSLSGLGGLGPSLSSLSGSLSGMAGSDRMAAGDRHGMGDGRDRMGGIERMMDKLRDNRDMRDARDDGGRRVTRPDNCTVVVKNLPYSTNWQALKEHFRDAGDVKFAEIVMDKGRSTGVGYVRFSNEVDAQRAINQLHRSRLERRNIDVSLHRN